MKTVLIRDHGDYTLPQAETFDLTQMDIHSCTGCWSCWWATPGRCVYKELDGFYRAYVNADKVVFVLRPEKGFVSLAFKSLLDRMCPLFLPYMEFRDGGSWHKKRYERYPDVHIYYEDIFESDDDRAIFCDYVRWVFVQFASQDTQVLPVSELEKEAR